MTDQQNQMPVLIYVAGPLFGSGRMTNNVRRAIRAADILRQADFRFVPFVPHLFSLWDTVSPKDDVDYWLSMDKVWLEQCHAMIRLPGLSPGSLREEKWAEDVGIPVYSVAEGALLLTMRPVVQALMADLDMVPSILPEGCEPDA